ncbi:hypothetical protein ACHAXS_000731 [Conticribra weissflogii]
MPGSNRPDVLINTSIDDWHLKHQATIETGVFGTEIVAMKMGVDTLSENMYINKNYSKPDSTLNKKNNAVFYHAVRVSVAM